MARHRTYREQPGRCKCMSGGDAAGEHRKPGKTAADHGDIFAHTGCFHSELSHTTKAQKPQRTMQRLKLQ